MASDISHNLYFESCSFTDEVKSKFPPASQAVSAWHSYCALHPEHAETNDFGSGFKAAYADYLEHGSGAHSLQLSPLRYWKLHRETTAGREAAKQWLAGFRAGAAAARRRGFRKRIVTPVADADPPRPFANSPSASPPFPDEGPKPRALPSSALLGQGGSISNAATPPDQAPTRKPHILPKLSIEQPKPPQGATARKEVEAAMPVDWTRLPRNADMLSRIGRIMLAGDSPAMGLQWLHAALQVDPHHAPTHKALMEYYQHKGDSFRAAEHRAQAEKP